MSFGEYLSKKRKELRITVREFAKIIGISPSFLSDLENGNRAFPANSRKYPNLLENIIVALSLNESEADTIKNLAKESMLLGDRVPPEISDYLKKVPEAQQALRIAEEKGLSKEEWEKIVKIIEGE